MQGLGPPSAARSAWAAAIFYGKHKDPEQEAYQKGYEAGRQGR